MSRSNASGSRPKVEGRKLRGPVPECFEAFYRTSLRFCTGSRITSAALKGRYDEWAGTVEAAAMSFLAIRRAMANIGHRHASSNGIYYADVAFAEDAPSLADNYPAPPILPPSDAAALIERIDNLAGQLGAVRKVAAQLALEGTRRHV